ncbi:PREDICTED: chondroitin sulfate N-acetylgalactosaminyltransferase 2-like [Priapulus caudatus]|uniref:Hexosyltransferase n=1 Tax=Priapulus caudatus TaxID=37621 RepID=A0ABM1EN73_PRICU|nr:PREDICTED: chondroitin sulfate N-acetylgalactosaminyltransferase 2-like [Priapulus caudatus]
MTPPSRCIPGGRPHQRRALAAQPHAEQPAARIAHDPPAACGPCSPRIQQVSGRRGCRVAVRGVVATVTVGAWSQVLVRGVSAVWGRVWSAGLVESVGRVEFLQNCRLNAKIGRQVYYPVVFSQYNPDIVKAYSPEKYTKDLLDINKYTGMWLHYGFGMACMFGVDYRAVGGFRLDLAGWGGEDVDLYEKHVASDIQVFRAMDPGLIHIYHAKNCSAAAAGARGQPDQQHMCNATLADTYASRTQLALMLLSGKTPPGST